MMFWKELRPEHVGLFKVERIDCSAIFILYNNTIRQGNENNLNIKIATVDPEVWFNELVPTILDRVSYICKSPTFEVRKYNDGDLVVYPYLCETKEFDSIGTVEQFLESLNFQIVVLYSIVKYVDLTLLKEIWKVRFAIISDKQSIRSKKLDYLTDGTSND